MEAQGKQSMCLLGMRLKTTISLLVALSFLTTACDQSNTGPGSGPVLSKEEFYILCENIPEYDYSPVCFASDALSISKNFDFENEEICSWGLIRRDEGENVGGLVIANSPSVQALELTFASNRRNAIMIGGEVTDISDLGDEAYTASAQGLLRVRIGSIVFTVSTLPSAAEQLGCTNDFDGAIAMAHIIVDHIVVAAPLL